MRTFTFTPLLGWLLLAPNCAAAISPYAGPGGLPRVAQLAGWVELTDPQLKQTWDLARNAPLLPGDRLTLADHARLAIRLDGGARLLATGPATLEIAAVATHKETPLLRLKHGELLVESGELPLRIASDYGAVVVAAESRVLLYLGGNGVDLSVLKGDAKRIPPTNAPLNERPQRLRAGECVNLTLGKIAPLDSVWRDAAESLTAWAAPRPPSGRARDPRLGDWLAAILPPGLEDDLRDLEDAGEWRALDGGGSQGGWGWFPARTPAGWQPFSDGGWRWTRLGLFWIPDEPWGWLPYRYGTWRNSPSEGWYWLPDEQFGGAAVLFYQVGSMVGWAPAQQGASGDWTPAGPLLFPAEGADFYDRHPAMERVAPGDLAAFIARRFPSPEPSPESERVERSAAKAKTRPRPIPVQPPRPLRRLEIAPPKNGKPAED